MNVCHTHPFLFKFFMLNPRWQISRWPPATCYGPFHFSLRVKHVQGHFIAVYLVCFILFNCFVQNGPTLYNILHIYYEANRKLWQLIL